MSIKDKKNSLRFNVVDVLIIIGVIAVIIFCVGVLSGKFSESRIVNVNYCIKLEGVDENAASALSKGMRVYSTDMNIPIGVVKSTETKPMTVTSYDHLTNRFVTSEQESIYNLYIYLTAGCVHEEGCYKTENIRISENTNLEVNLPFKYDTAEIISVTPDYAMEDNNNE